MQLSVAIWKILLSAGCNFLNSTYALRSCLPERILFLCRPGRGRTLLAKDRGRALCSCPLGAFGRRCRSATAAMRGARESSSPGALDHTIGLLGQYIVDDAVSLFGIENRDTTATKHSVDQT